MQHQDELAYLQTLLSIYLERNPVGTIIGAPFVMWLSDMEFAYEPDLFVVLNENRGRLHDTYLQGPADICIEVVSPESGSRDHGSKLEEYERGGVGEYWIIDRIRQECRFFRLSDEGHYLRQWADVGNYYITPRLPQFRLHVLTLLQGPLSGPSAIAESVRHILG